MSILIYLKILIEIRLFMELQYRNVQIKLDHQNLPETGMKHLSSLPGQQRSSEVYSFGDSFKEG